MKRAGRKQRLEQGGSGAQEPMALQPNYAVAGQRAGMGPHFRKKSKSAQKNSGTPFPFSSEDLYLRISSPKKFSRSRNGQNS